MFDQHQLTEIDDAARFAADDPVPLVWASLACRMCLHQPTLVSIGGPPDTRVAAASCAACAAVTRVQLTEEQAHRIWTLPRGRTFVHFPPALW